ncbi:integrase core domain-containing protein [Hyphomonas sp.]
MPADPDERLLRWMHFYNRERPHAALGKATPNEAYGTGNELKKAA